MNHLIELEEKLDNSFEFARIPRRGVKKRKGASAGKNTIERTEAYNRLRMKALRRNPNYRLKNYRASELPSSHLGK